MANLRDIQAKKFALKHSISSLKDSIARWKETAKTEKETLREATIQYKRTKQHIAQMEQQLRKERDKLKQLNGR
jgi:chromosome segregation ATPase